MKARSGGCNHLSEGWNDAGSVMSRFQVLKVSVLVPAFNEEANVRRAYTAIVDTFRNLPDYDYEIIFTDNHSTDATFDILKGIASADRRVRVIRFSRNIGYQRSLLAAYKAASGDCSVQIDCDLQDPPHLIPDMLALWRQGNQVVYGIRRSLKDGWVTAMIRRAFYRLVRALSEDDLPLNAGEFRLVDRCILDELRRVDDTSPYLRGLISAMGFRQVGFEYDRQSRVAGESKFPLTAMLALAVDAILNHSLVPLRLASITSVVVGTVTFLLLLGYRRRLAGLRAAVASGLCDDDPPAAAFHDAERNVSGNRRRVCRPDIHAVQAAARHDRRGDAERGAERPCVW